jgi:hypothetical protein
MAGIFISYRRDDASGHAGRLFDRLAQRFGRERVFMDVTDIAPGEDFTHVIETSVGTSELLLAVIGPQWLGAADSRGSRRLDDPADFVRQEIGAAFQRQVRVIPVLVRGARMPREEELPQPLKPLARRQAVELTDTRWESDLAHFEQALGEQLRGPLPTRATHDARHSFSRNGIAAAIVILLIAGLAYLWRGWSGDGHEPPTEAIAPGSRSAESTGRPDETAPGTVSGVRRALPLPAVARFKLAGQQFEILALRTEASGDQELLTMRLRMTNTGNYPDTFTNVAAVLETGGGAIAPVAPVFELIPGHSAKDGELQFPLPSSTGQATLVLRHSGQETRIPLAVRDGKTFTVDATVDAFGRPKRPQLVDTVESFPLDLALPAQHSAQFGGAGLSLRSLRLDRYNVETAVLEVAVQASASPDARGGINFWSDNVRLHVDGMPRAPQNAVNELVPGGTSRTATFEFLLTDAPARLEVSLRAGDAESDRWPITIPGVK